MVVVPIPQEHVVSVGSGVWILGDSWAGADLRDFVSARLPGRRVELLNMPGAKSRDVLVQAAQSPVLRDTGVSKAVVLVGVNDSNGHDGPDFYRQHVEQIKKLLQQCGKEPVFVEIPDYELTLATAPTVLFSVKRLVSLMLFDRMIWDNRAAYRKALKELNVATIKAPSRTETPGLYRDFLHLNTEGNKVLADRIAVAVAQPVDSSLPR